MTLNTSALRRVWAPACQNKGPVFLPAYEALDRCLKEHGYAPRKVDTGAFNCRKITGGSGYSLHAYGPGDRFTFWNGLTIATSLAVDINWQSNPYSRRLITDMPGAMVADIKAIRTVNGKQVWGWGGDYRSNKDAMHFEIVCSPADLATGIAGTKRPQAEPQPSEEDDMPLNQDDKDWIKKTVGDAVSQAVGAVWIDEANDIKDAETARRQYGSLRGWVAAIAEKMGVSQEDAVRHDFTNKR